MTEAAERGARPAILTVDDDPNVSRAVARDLRRRYGEGYRVVRAESGPDALDALREIKLRGGEVAVLLADYRMPRMSGIEFLEEAMDLFPGARRVLLTAYADTDAAIQAINVVDVDHYLLKPWDPPEEKLYPVVDALLDAWLRTDHGPVPETKVVGHRWSARSYKLRDFLARNQVPYRWYLADEPEGARLLAAAGADESTCPVVITDDGQALVQPTNAELAERDGLSTTPSGDFYDLVVVGGGPAGLGAEVLTARTVVGLEARGSARVVRFDDGGELAAHTVILATGVSYRLLGAPGLTELAGRGVYYGAATTEAPNCAGQDVYIVGGANSAGQAAVYFARHARRVVMLVRGDTLQRSMSAYLIQQIAEVDNIEVRTCWEVVTAEGDDHLQKITLRDNTTGLTETVEAHWLFLFIGAAPGTEWLDGLVERDDRGFVLAGPDLVVGGQRPRGWTLDRDPYHLETSVPGVFVAGDVRAESVKRVASAVGEGAMAVTLVHRYL